MSERFQSPRRRGNVYQRGRGTGRGRGYPDPYQQHLNSLGIERDLREKLDRKRSERGQDFHNNGPPKDPSYNFLNDPEREPSPIASGSGSVGNNAEHNRDKRVSFGDSSERRHQNTRPITPKARRKVESDENPSNSFKNHASHKNDSMKQDRNPTKHSNAERPNFNKNSDRPFDKNAPKRNSGRYKNLEKNLDIQNPPNIKIELKTDTGDKTYTVLEENTLPDIKHIPDKPFKSLNKPAFRGRGRFRGRGVFRGGSRGRSARQLSGDHQSQEEETSRNYEKKEHQDESSSFGEEENQPLKDLADESKENECEENEKNEVQTGSESTSKVERNIKEQNGNIEVSFNHKENEEQIDNVANQLKENLTIGRNKNEDNAEETG